MMASLASSAVLLLAMGMTAVLLALVRAVDVRAMVPFSAIRTLDGVLVTGGGRVWQLISESVTSNPEIWVVRIIVAGC